MKHFILLTEKSWHDELFEDLVQRPREKWYRVKRKEDFDIETLHELKPDLIFIPHWSHIIPKKIWSEFICVVFHMTDLPYGRGGSPLQNLIVKGHKETKISAIKVNEGIDTGPIYLKAPLSLTGTAQEVFERSVPIIKDMITKIIDDSLQPTSQEGQPVIFKRRKPADGRMNDLIDLNTVYDYIRMLDAEGYPPAFIETENLLIEFKDASLTENSEIQANVRITKR